ncbi:Fc.00g025870.m01.CDS01 [Cosmosporella sp. VM-42]
MQLWKVFVDNVDPCTKVLHIPTDEVMVYTVVADPSKASTESLGLCFAVYYLATIALEPGDVEAITGEDKEISLRRFKTGLEQALAHADFLENPTVVLLQALAIYLSALRVHNSGRAVWTLIGLAIRAAQSMGLHRDGKKLGLSPFESEVRRRLWWHFLGRDARAVEDYGLQNTSAPSLMSGVDMPLNLEDSDLWPEMNELPRPRAGWTKMTLALVNIEITRAWAELGQLSSATNGPPREEDRARIVRDLTCRMEDVLKYCNPVVPQQRMTVEVARFIMRKMDLVTRQQWRAMNHPGDQELLATEENLLEALSVLEEADSTWHDDLLRPFRWSMRSYPQYHMMLYILWHLCVRPEGPSVHRALAAVNAHLEKAKLAEKGPFQGSKWPVLMALKAKATGMIQKPEQGSTNQHQENAHTPDDTTTNLSFTNNAGPAERNDLFRNDGTQSLPDWSTLLQDFQLDGTDFSIMY